MRKLLLTGILTGLTAMAAHAQVNAVEFGKNRVQYKQFKWKFYQTQNFNTYFSQNGQELAKYVAQVAEKELPEIEAFCEYGLQRRANIVVYNTFDDMQQSNIGLGFDWQNTGGNTKLVNNKMVVYFNGDHANLRRQIREGLAKVLLSNVLFGDDIGEFAGNQALLDLPKWLTDGYVSYVGQNWNPELDDQLKSVIGSGSYRNFYQFAFDKPMLAGHAFWYFIEEKYKRENVTYFLYLARVYKSLNIASQRICKKKIKPLLAEFMEYQYDKFNKDIRQRRNVPRGRLTVSEEVGNRLDYTRFQANPNPRNNSYAVVEFKKGIYRVIYVQDWYLKKTLLKFGVRSYMNEKNPNYPILAWDPKGSRLAVVYWEEGKTKLFVYDVVTRFKQIKQELPQFDQIQDMQYMLDPNTLVFSAVKNGHSDIFVYKIDKQSLEQITNDVYDDLDPTFVAFPNKTGIIFSSNRPSGNAPTGDTILPSDNNYNIFLVDNWNKSEFRQISKLTNIRYGNARYPMQYNTSHFTFVSDENGIGNRYAGFFTTERAGIDTLVRVGDDILRNPSNKELDSLLRAYKKQAPDSIGYMSITNDSAYTFPLTNYASSLIETRIAGEGGQVSEVRREGDFKFLYKLKVDDNTLKRRNVTARPTEYMKRVIIQDKIARGEALINRPNADTAKKNNDVFQNEFGDEKVDSSASKIGRIFEGQSLPGNEPLLKKAKLFDYKLKFSLDNLTTGFDNTFLLNRFQPFQFPGPISPGTGYGLNGLTKASVVDLMEDLRFTGGFRLPTFFDNRFGNPTNNFLLNNGGEFFFITDWLKWRFDLRGTYYRNDQPSAEEVKGINLLFRGRRITNLYQADLRYPFDRVKSLRTSLGVRRDKIIYKALSPISLPLPDSNRTYGIMRLEYVYDNTVNPTLNIWNGLRYKFYVDLNTQISKQTSQSDRSTFNVGFDARYYYPIYRNFIWAGRVAGDFSFGERKMIYYLGGSDGWLRPRFDTAAVPQDPDYAYMALAQNLRGFNQNVSNGNNNIVINSELRFPIFTTLLNRPINNPFIRNMQLTQFIDLGTAWNGTYNSIKRPSVIYNNGGPVSTLIKAGGIGPFAGGYGFGLRSTALGYFLKVDAAWQMNVFFKGKPAWFVGMGVDF